MDKHESEQVLGTAWGWGTTEWVSFPAPQRPHLEEPRKPLPVSGREREEAPRGIASEHLPNPGLLSGASARHLSGEKGS